MPFSNEEEAIFKLGPGTPSGELFRRYWLPVETSANLGGGRGPVVPSAKNPLPLKVLGEYLVLYRDATGQPGLLAEHCSHRGTSLRYGRVEDNGLRCLYHGWLYDIEGKLVGAPYMKEAEGFDPKNCRLDPVNIDIWRGWVFVNLGPDCEPLEDFVADFESDFGSGFDIDDDPTDE